MPNFIIIKTRYSSFYGNDCAGLSMQPLAAFAVYGLQHYGDYDEENAAPEGASHFPTLVEDDHGEDDAVDRLHIVRQVHREGRDGAHGLQLKEEGYQGEYRGEDGHIHQVVAGDGNGSRRIEVKVEGHEECKHDNANEELAQQEVAALYASLVLHLFAKYRREGVHYRATEAEEDAQTIAWVEAEDEQYAHNGEDAQRYLLHTRPTAFEDGLYY